MGQVATKSTRLAPQREVQAAIRKFARHLPPAQRSLMQKTSKMLAELPASERRAAVDIIRRRDKNEGLDFRWLTSFVAVLRKLKAEER